MHMASLTGQNSRKQEIARDLAHPTADVVWIMQIIERLLNLPTLPKKGVDYFTEAEIETFLKLVTPVKGKHYVDGEKGDKGDDGYTPKKGIDYVDGEPGEDGKDADLQEAAAIARKLLEAHRKEYDHAQIHDSKILGGLELDLSQLKDGQLFQRKGNLIVGIDLPKMVREEGRKYYGSNSPTNPKLTSTVITASTTLTSDHSLVLINAASGNITVTLPDANAFDRWQFYLKRTDSSSNTVDVALSGSNTLDGETTDQLPNQYSIRRYVSANDNWFKL